MIILNNDQFGKNLRFLRLKRNLSRRRLAAILGLRVSQVIFMETGWTMEFDHLLMHRISRLFDVELSDLVHQNLVKEKRQ